MTQQLSAFESVTYINYKRREATDEEQMLFTHLQELARSGEPEYLISCFKSLFIDGCGYIHQDIVDCIHRIVDFDAAEIEFKHIITRSCYILVNRWLQSSQTQVYIPELVELFANLPTQTPTSWTSQRLRTLVKAFIASEQYRTLYKLSRMFERLVEDQVVITKPEDQKLEGLINRYPYLYEHYLLDEDSSREQRREIRSMKKREEEKYGRKLSEFITNYSLESIESLSNPTLLPNQEVYRLVNHFTSKVDGVNTYQDLADQFRVYCQLLRSFKAFKDSLYEYLTTSIDLKYINGQFKQRLYKYLQNTTPENDDHKPTEMLMMTTCRRILSFLIVESEQQPKHYVFYDLVNNIGTSAVVGMLLKIVLFCRPIKPFLEQRFAILFQHYQGWNREKIWWLVRCLETLNVALSVNFSTVNLYLSL